MTKHNCADKIPEYRSWSHMKNRCYNINNKKYKDYGGRGIIVDIKWKEDFATFYKDMGPKPGIKYSIDRINNDENYCKENCKWSTPSEQARNRRNNKIITYNNKTQILIKWSEELNIPLNILATRLNKHKWSIEKSFTIPVRSRYKYIEFNNKKQTLKKWSEELNITDDILSYRLLNNWSVEKTLTTPVRKCIRKNNHG